MTTLPDLSHYSIDELKKIITEAEKALRRRRKEARHIARFAAEQAAIRHGFTLDDLVVHPKKPGRHKPKQPPKYRNPDNPSQTWSGRGRRPSWVKAAFAMGKTRDDLAI